MGVARQWVALCLASTLPNMELMQQWTQLEKGLKLLARLWPASQWMLGSSSSMRLRALATLSWISFELVSLFNSVGTCPYGDMMQFNRASPAVHVFCTVLYTGKSL